MSDVVVTPDLSSEQISSTTRETNYGTWRFQKTWKPLHIVDAEGCWFTDGAGKRYLDFSAQLMCVNLGHKNPRVVEAIAEQARELAFVGAGVCDHCPRAAEREAARSAAGGAGQVLLCDQRDRGQRSRVQDCAHGDGQEQDHLPLPVVSRVDERIDRGHGRPAALGDGAGGQGHGLCVCARNELLRRAPSSTPIRGATLPARITSST